MGGSSKLGKINPNFSFQKIIEAIEQENEKTEKIFEGGIIEKISKQITFRIDMKIVAFEPHLSQKYSLFKPDMKVCEYKNKFITDGHVSNSILRKMASSASIGFKLGDLAPRYYSNRIAVEEKIYKVEIIIQVIREEN